MTQAHMTSSEGESHGSYTSYIVGFVLAVILTVASFATVMRHVFTSAAGTIIALAVLAAVQVIVHLVFFLHMNRSSKQRWNVMTFLVAVLTLAIFIGGTLFIMGNTHMYMMSR